MRSPFPETSCVGLTLQVVERSGGLHALLHDVDGRLELWVAVVD